jgi:hypothetical protein
MQMSQTFVVCDSTKSGGDLQKFLILKLLQTNLLEPLQGSGMYL